MGARIFKCFKKGISGLTCNESYKTTLVSASACNFLCTSLGESLAQWIVLLDPGKNIYLVDWIRSLLFGVCPLLCVRLVLVSAITKSSNGIHLHLANSKVSCFPPTLSETNIERVFAHAHSCRSLFCDSVLDTFIRLGSGKWTASVSAFSSANTNILSTNLWTVLLQALTTQTFAIWWRQGVSIQCWRFEKLKKRKKPKGTNQQVTSRETWRRQPFPSRAARGFGGIRS